MELRMCVSLSAVAWQCYQYTFVFRVYHLGRRDNSRRWYAHPVPAIRAQMKPHSVPFQSTCPDHCRRSRRDCYRQQGEVSVPPSQTTKQPEMIWIAASHAWDWHSLRPDRVDVIVLHALTPSARQPVQPVQRVRHEQDAVRPRERMRECVCRRLME